MDKADKQRKFARAQERKQEKVQTETVKSLKQQVEDLKKQVEDGKKPLRQKIERLKAQIEELEKEKLHALNQLAGQVRENERLVQGILGQNEVIERLKKGESIDDIRKDIESRNSKCVENTPGQAT